MDRYLGKRHIDKIVGNNLRAAREARKMSAYELADLIGLTRGQIGLIEHGKRGITSLTMSQLPKIFNMPLERFFFEWSEEEVENFKEDESEYNAYRAEIQSMLACMTKAELKHTHDVVKSIMTLYKVE